LTPGTWGALQAAAEQRLRAIGVDDPTTEARWMLEEVSGMDASEQILEADRRATRRATVELDGLLARRTAGEPLQYVLGSWGFCGLDLLVDRRVLIPRPETESVVQHAIAEVERLGERVGKADPWAGALTHYAVADLGTGSGAIALALAAALPDAEVWATDVSDDALAVARANLAGAGTTAARVRVAAGSWFSALPDALRGGLLLVIANPPYVASDEELPTVVRDWEPASALVAGPTGLEALEVLVDEAPAWLDPAGTLVLELAPHQGDAIAERARAGGFAEVLLRHDLTGRIRTLIARRRAD
jgi:release factor glutamine methyltransferase